MSAQTLYDKIWDAHKVCVLPDTGETLIYVDLHLIHEVTSPQAFAGLDAAGRKVYRPERTLAVADHNTPTAAQEKGLSGVADPDARAQLQALGDNVQRHGIEFFAMGDPRNGIVHVVGPEQGRTQPGMVIVCGDSHTSTHGAFGALAHGIGTSEVEHVLATQTLRTRKMKNMRLRIEGALAQGVTAKDMALYLIARFGTALGTGYVMEFSGSAVLDLSMEGRMTLCNMAIEAGARAGLIAPDDTSFAWLKGRPGVPKQDAWDKAVSYWKTLHSDPDAQWDSDLEIAADQIEPMVTWGTSPEQAVPINGHVPDPSQIQDLIKRQAAIRALRYMGLEPGQKLAGLKLDRVFIGSCTNSRIEDLRAVADIARNGHVAPHVRAMIVPGSGLVKAQAEQEGLDRIFLEAGFEWRQPGCSMCLGMNPDILQPKERCASTSNRNFEGRQGRQGRTHLLGPALAAQAALCGTIAPLAD